MTKIICFLTGVFILLSCAPSQAAPGCSTPAPTTAAGYDAVFDSFDLNEWGGADQATTVKLPDGRTVWLFGDTLGPGYFEHNSFVVQDQGCFDVIRKPIPDRPDGTYYWPSHAVVDLGVLIVFVQRIGPANGSFTVLGTEMARFRLSDLKFLGRSPTPSANRTQDHPTFPDTEPGGVLWGASVHRHGSYVYVYANQSRPGFLVFGKGGYVARVPAGKLTNLNSWRYWNGSSWVTGEAKAKQILDENVHGMSTNWSSYHDGNGWVLIHKKFDLFGTEIVSLRSSKPSGPWTEKLLATVAPWDDPPGHFTYNAAAHPHLGLASGKTLISLSHNDQRVFEDFSLYRPEFFELIP